MKEAPREINLILTTFFKLLNEYNYALEVYAKGAFVFVDKETNKKYMVDEEELNRLYKEVTEGKK
ncbi:hypothetical protein KQI68_07045 [Peptoniphilus sp. MSJ-1]|uniref:Uncharacterized protein n=1 Tax=Peptoniphilus ovalis TaxID=2841503 RepID=A0ABS6FHE1_9FIRM|nr:hypothetical protein [Peptoniphilus ovalis]MBU5669594.1 hypothetical protein [Peptoniphilus ovalis]